MNNKNCTCEEPHISDRIQHMYDGSPCYVKTTPTTPSEWGGFKEQAIRVFQRHGRNEYAGGAKGAYQDLEYRIESLLNRALHHNTEDIIGQMEYGVNHVEIKGQRQHAEDKTPEQAALIQEIYDNHIKPVLLKTLRALKPTHK